MDDLKAQLLEVLHLKDVARAGWLRVGVESPESVAAHSWGVAYLVLALAPADIDRGRALAIAVLHDVAEARTGDLTPHDDVSREEKRNAEQIALCALTSALPHQQELLSLFAEYETGSTPEGRFVKACDKLDMALQAQRYDSAHVNTEEFIASALAVLSDTTLRELASND